MSQLSSAPPRNLLIVDDDPVITALLAFTLHRHGFNALTAESTESARSIWDKNPVDILFTDLRLPGDSGLVLAVEARGRNPAICTVLMTAAGDENLTQMLQRPEIDFVLAKPFSLSDVDIAC